MRTDPLAYLGQELEGLKQQKLYRQLRILEGEQKAHTTVDHKSVVNLSSNNYLGLTTHPKLRARAAEAVEKFGVGTGSVRTIAGTMSLHEVTEGNRTFIEWSVALDAEPADSERWHSQFQSWIPDWTDSLVRTLARMAA